MMMTMMVITRMMMIITVMFLTMIAMMLNYYNGEEPHAMANPLPAHTRPGGLNLRVHHLGRADEDDEHPEMSDH